MQGDRKSTLAGKLAKLETMGVSTGARMDGKVL